MNPDEFTGKLLEEILVDAYGEDEQLWALRQVFEDEVPLNGLLIADLRCLDAHAHLGNLAFDRSPKTALRHYDIGRQIGELSLGPDFNGVLPWGLIDNRPYLRCVHGYGLCLWRLERFDEACVVFTRMLWLNPSDNQGARFNLRAVSAGSAWEAES